MAILLATACKPKPKPIQYGLESCDYCRMTIVDTQHAAEAVTDKGKAYVFDAIECMIQFKAGHADKDFALLLINDYAEAGTLKDATQATYLISSQVPSPMGAFLSGFSNPQDAEKMRAAKGGDLYSWAEIEKKISTTK